LLVAWTVIALSYTYSRGDRAGYIQKLSKKGWICKTWEGELAMVNIPGAMQERFPFTVRSDSLATTMNKLMGSQVSLTYEEHRGVPGSCFGETNYYVTSVRPVGPVAPAGPVGPTSPVIPASPPSPASAASPAGQ
jgi:hypothetical protein